MYVCMYIFINIKNNSKLEMVHRYRNISFHWLNRYSSRYKIDSLGKYIKVTKTILDSQDANPTKYTIKVEVRPVHVIKS